MVTAWDAGLIAQTRIISRVEIPVADLPFVRDQVLRVTNGTAEDPFIAQAIRAATEYGEAYMGRALADTTFETLLSQFPARELRLPWPPLIALTSLAYLDSSGASVDVDVASVRVVPSGRASKAVLLPTTSNAWPVASGEPGSVTIRYRAGYSDATTIPVSIQHGIALVVGELYKQRSESVEGTIMRPTVVRALDLWNGWTIY